MKMNIISMAIIFRNKDHLKLVTNNNLVTIIQLNPLKIVKNNRIIDHWIQRLEIIIIMKETVR